MRRPFFRAILLRQWYWGLCMLFNPFQYAYLGNGKYILRGSSVNSNFVDVKSANDINPDFGFNDIFSQSRSKVYKTRTKTSMQTATSV